MYCPLEDPDPCPRRNTNNCYLKIFGFVLGFGAALTIVLLIYYSTLLRSEREHDVLIKFEKILENQNQTNLNF